MANAAPGDAHHDRAFGLLPRRAAVAYLGAANGDRRRWYRAVSEALASRYGAEVRHARSGTSEEREEARRIIADADLIYAAGGDVALLAERTREGKLDLAIRARHAAGASLVGISAGAIGLCAYWVRFPEDDPGLSRPARFPCIGALRIAVDVHDEANDWEELRALLACWGEDEPDAVVLGFGIPTGGALQIDVNGAAEPLGPAPKRLLLSRGKIQDR
jgi:cyanophycinase-like exopeptidase